MRRTTILVTALILAACASSSTAEVGMNLVGPAGVAVPRGVPFRPGDEVTAEVDLGLYAVAPTIVTEYRVTLESPRLREQQRANRLISEVVPLEPGVEVIPGETKILRYSLVASPAMAEFLGDYVLTIEIQQLGVSAVGRFSVQN